MEKITVGHLKKLRDAHKALEALLDTDGLSIFLYTSARDTLKWIEDVTQEVIDAARGSRS